MVYSHGLHIPHSSYFISLLHLNSNLLKKLPIMQRVNDIQLQEKNMRLNNSKKLNSLMKCYKADICIYYVDILKKTRKKEPC